MGARFCLDLFRLAHFVVTLLLLALDFVVTRLLLALDFVVTLVAQNPQ